MPVGTPLPRQQPLRVVLVEDDERLASLFTAALTTTSDLQLVGRASTLASGMARSSRNRRRT